MSNYERIHRLASAITDADCVVVGAGAGLSAAAGFDYAGERFTKWCKPWEDKYGVHDFYSAGFYPYPTREEFWGFWSAMILANRYECGVGQVYVQLKELLEDKEHFVITTNVDHQFQLAGFDKQRLFYTQGDYGLFQCSGPCCQETFDDEDLVRVMHESIEETAISSELIPRCPHCGREMTTNLRCDDTFVEDEGWHLAAKRYRDFLNKHEGEKVLFLELGVGFNTPGIIKYPFWQMTSENPNAIFACINMGQAAVHPLIEERSIVVDEDIAFAVDKLLKLKHEGG